ncbi:hypothetical protein B9Z19DRAFT_1040095 [Tuber borchii]|uniref:Cora-like Mg2+ transporter protein-domain-containing protein n=1 Tax=Tuber borchii TaxID=42251 RepID=A0A2T7A5C2_TUBBO|nr:hypothetical protein B9Z19DRAFT_1040095 [Tuber borchii]
MNPHSAPGPSAGPIFEPSQPPQQSPTLSQELADRFAGWETIDEQRAFYDERDCLDPGHNLASKILKRAEDNVVIFDYSLDLDYPSSADGNTPAEEGGPSSGHFSADDIFFQVPKHELIGSKQFDQIINPAKEPLLIRSRGPRLGIIDFPQCYHTYKQNDTLNSMAEKLGLKKEGKADFMGGCLKRVRELPGREGFRTGISLQAHFKEPSDLPRPGSPESPKSGSSEDRFILFASFPYFGRSSQNVTLGPKSESVKLIDFKRLAVDVPDPKPGVMEEGEILVHQVQYMLFDNYTMATFRSKEDGAKNQVPLHRFQERVGAFRAMIHMIANRTELELRTLRKLQISLCKLEEDIDQMISDAETHEDNQGIERIPDDYPPSISQSLEMTFTEEERSQWNEDYEQARQNNARKRKQRRVRELLASLNSLSAALFAAISVAERQIAVLRDLHSVFSMSYRTKAKDYERGYPLRRNPFHRNVALIPILSENPEQIWPNTLDTIDEVVRERKSFIKKVKELVQNMDIRRKILSAFVKTDQAKAAPTEKTAQETTSAVKRAEDAIKETTAQTQSVIRETTRAIERTETAMRETRSVIKGTQAELVQQGQVLTSFTIVTTAFLPLSFCASYFGMNNIKEFSDNSLSLHHFWQITGPILAGVLVLTIMVVLWKREWAVNLRSGRLGGTAPVQAQGLTLRGGFHPRRRIDIENAPSPAPNLPALNGQVNS